MKIARKVIVLCLYLAVLSYGLFFAEVFGRGGTGSFSYNFIPFHEILRYFVRFRQIGIYGFMLNIVGNILAFMPFGWLLTSLFPKSMPHRKTIVSLTGMGFSAMVEMLQYITSTGSCDVDDVILNTAGAFFGALCYVIFEKVRKEDDQCSISED